MGEGLSIGELAGRAGVSVRALRLYEEAGLLTPLRTRPTGQGPGRRVYGATEVARLAQVSALKRAGFTLKRIGELLAGRGAPDAAELVEAQIALLETQAREVQRGLKSLRAARARLRDGQPLDLATLCDLIRRGDATMIDNEAWARVFERYYSPEDVAKWERAKARFDFTSEEAAGYSARWRALIDEVEAAIAQGAAPASPEGVALGERWYALQRPIAEAVGATTWGKAAAMYRDMESWRTPEAEPPFSKAVYDYACQMVEAARAEGRVPPLGAVPAEPAA